MNIIAHTAITRQEACVHVTHTVLVQERVRVPRDVMYLNNVIASIYSDHASLERLYSHDLTDLVQYHYMLHIDNYNVVGLLQYRQ